MCLWFLPILLKISKNGVCRAQNLSRNVIGRPFNLSTTKPTNQVDQGEPCVGGNVAGCCFLFAEARWRKPARAVDVSSFWRENSGGD